jgi:1,4-alpha-glucan branching enzyme
MQPRHTGTNSTLDRGIQQKSRTSAASKPASSRRLEKHEEKPRSHSTKQVLLSVSLPNVQSVCVAGTFNNWDPRQTVMEKHGQTWKATLSLPSGRYEYKFVADGRWMSDPGAKESIRNDFGGTNSILVV